MAKNLLIVESPAKAKTINKYLGKDFQVLASYGHVRDLRPKEGAVDPDADFAMAYELIEKNEKHVDAITKAAKSATALYLATDLDREGEAISWHIAEILRERNLLEGKALHRVVFSEITPHAIQEAVANPRALSLDLVNAQQARRALDYLVGFNLSPVLWRKVQRGLSAGRVQSPALRMIVEREEEIEAFRAREYWTIEADCAHPDQRFSARLLRLRGKKFEQFDLTNEADAHAARDALIKSAQGRLVVSEVQSKERKRRPSPPFTTSTLQQEAARKLGFTTSRTMRLAQGLYEGVAIGSEGTVGLITYMRTDSVSLGNDAIAEIRKVIARDFGSKALPESPNLYRSKSKNAQEAHEAIRPTSALHTPTSMAAYLNDDQRKLYDLIWKRAVASQMQYATLNTVSVDFDAGGDAAFRASGTTVVDAGFLAVYEEGRDQKGAEDDDENRKLPAMKIGEAVPLAGVLADQHFTEPPPRFSEASLVKTLEEYGIGRPSTYASIIQVLLNREYVTLESRRFRPTDVGRAVGKFPRPAISPNTSTTTSPRRWKTNSTRSAVAKKPGCRYCGNSGRRSRRSSTTRPRASIAAKPVASGCLAMIRFPANRFPCAWAAMDRWRRSAAATTRKSVSRACVPARAFTRSRSRMRCSCSVCRAISAPPRTARRSASA